MAIVCISKRNVIMCCAVITVLSFPVVFRMCSPSLDVTKKSCFHEQTVLTSRHNFRLPNTVISEYDSIVAERLTKLVARNATAADVELIHLIRDMLDPPSKHSLKKSRDLVVSPQAKEIDIILNKMSGGFFIECGAYDGELLSNTLFFEMHRGWTGLLVEMDPYYYTQLVGKSRRAWSINACLSPHRHVTQMEFVESNSCAGRLIENSDGRDLVKRTKNFVPCFPVEALLVALNVTTVDFFSLDVEGFELPILRTVPFKKFDIRTLAVEYLHGASKQSYADFMAGENYIVHKEIHANNAAADTHAHDYIFVKSKSVTQ